MTFEIQTYQTSFGGMIGVLLLFLAAALITGLSLASRVMSARMENMPLTLRGRIDGGTAPMKALGPHKRLAVITLALAAMMLLLMLSLLGDCRMNIVNDDASDVLTITGQVDAIEHRTLLDGTIPFLTADGPTFGVRLIVDGDEYHALSDGGLAVGDTVTLQYLSGSRFVLHAGSGSNLPHPAITPQESVAAAAAASEAIPPVTALTFPFEDYRRIVTFETGLFLVIAVLLVHTVILTLKGLAQRRINMTEGLKTALFLFTYILLLTVGCSSVWNGGWRVLLEKPSEAITLQGEIQTIEALDSTWGVKFSTDWGTHFGCFITIDGESYFAMYEGDLCAGDAVEFTFLPESRYVLSIVSVEEIP